MDTRKLPKTKALLIVDNDRDIRILFRDLECDMAPLEEEHEKFHAMHQDLLNRQQAIHKKHWAIITKALVMKGFIDGEGVDLYMDNGVLYQGKEPSISFDMVKKLFGNNLN